MCVYTCVYVCECVRTRVSVCTCVSVCVHVCECVYTCVCECVHVCVWSRRKAISEINMDSVSRTWNLEK